jgi:hypothetical protein
MSLTKDNTPEHLLNCSQEYRSQLRAADDQLKDLIQPPYLADDSFDDDGGILELPPLPQELHLKRSLARQTNGEEQAQEALQLHLEALTAYLQLTEIVWHLCELLHLESSAKPISSSVIEWIQKFEAFVFGFPEHPEEFDEYLKEQSRDQHDVYFTVRYYVTHGRLKDAMRACRAIQQDVGSKLDDLVELLLEREKLSSSFNKSARGSKRKQQQDWQNWKHAVQRAKTRAEEESDDSVVWILELLLTGKNLRTEQGNELNRSWMSDVLLQLSYSQPQAVPHEVVRVMHKCLDANTDPDGIASNEYYTQLRVLVLECLYATRLPVVLEFLDGEGHNTVFIEELNVRGGITAPWSVAHLSDILFKHDILLDVPVDSALDATSELAKLALEQSPNLRDMYVEKYACSLQRGGGADLAADYLSTCTFQQRCDHPRMRDMLSRSSCLTDRRTEQILSVAQKYHLSTVVEDVCASRAAFWKQSGRTAQSLQWLSRCKDHTKLSEAVRSLLSRGPNATDYTALDTLLQGLGIHENDGDALSTSVAGTDTPAARQTSALLSGPIAFLSRYHETCVVIRNAEELRNALNGNDATMLDERGLGLATENLHFLESEAAKRISELLCDASLEEHPMFWLPLLAQLEPYVYRRPTVISASHGRRVLRRIEEISTSWRKDDFLPPVLPAWEQVRCAIVDVFQTWKLKGDPNGPGVFTGTNRTFEIKGDQYVSLCGSIPMLPTPESLSNANWVDNVEKVIKEEDLEKAYNETKQEASEYKKRTEGESGLVPRIRWALAENLSCSLGVAHSHQRLDVGSTSSYQGEKSVASRPSKHQRTSTRP